MNTTIHKNKWCTTGRAVDPVFRSAWSECDGIVDNGICHDTGPRVTRRLATKAMRNARVTFDDDLALTVLDLCNQERS